MFKTDIIVRFNDCDSLGHVNNAVYFTYLEEARKELFKIFNPSLSMKSWNLIVASTQCDFLQEIVYAQKVTVYTWVSQIGKSSFDVEHAIHDNNKNWIARGKVVLVSFDFNERKSVPLKEEIQEQLFKHQDSPVNVPSLK
ncbi:acyl-CoA thioesterase [Bacillus amyloliquefaciens]|uniref:acyl-CoA thioesterase n=1 Tax=Bacillus amyloliquefaciens TaxID=1390 RepID=UPI00209FD2C4|nr:thioesterase family protein [Bacillus amyloliquefaciens]MCP1462026.1 acyl-CoA thioester hydrolase [Bacillus amyloliquefaciens]